MPCSGNNTVLDVGWYTNGSGTTFQDGGAENYDATLKLVHGFALLTVILLSFGLNLVLVLAASVACSISNNKQGRTCLADQLIRIIAAICLLQTATKTLVQLINFVNGSSSTSYAACQFQGLLGSLLKYFLVGCVSLLVLDRMTKGLHPHEYPVTFTTLNAWVVLPGMFILILAQVTGPVYGWGAFIFDCRVHHCTLDPSARSACSYQILADMWLLAPHLIAMSNTAILLASKCLIRLHTSSAEPENTDASSTKRQFALWSNRQGLESMLLSGQCEQRTTFCLICVMMPLFLATSVTDGFRACSKRCVSAVFVTLCDIVANVTYVMPAVTILSVDSAPLCLLRNKIRFYCRREDRQNVRATTSSIELGSVGRRSCGLEGVNSSSNHTTRSSFLNL